MKLNTQALEDHWQEIVGKLHEKWGSISEQDLQKARGDVQQLVKAIQQMTGETKEVIQAFLDDVTNKYAGSVQQAADAIRGYAELAAETVHEATEQASETVRTGVRQTRQMVRNRPMESLVTCFGVGVVTGLMIGLLSRSR
jgi:uncharacterized protein YjbJ (UPF0337 family)